MHDIICAPSAPAGPPTVDPDSILPVSASIAAPLIPVIVTEQASEPPPAPISSNNNSTNKPNVTAADVSLKSAAVTAPKSAPASGANTNYCNRRTWITTERMNELRRRAQDAVKQNKTFTIRGCFHSVRNALTTRGWVEKLDVHRKQVPSGVCQVTYDDLAQGLPKRKAGETRRQYIAKCERNIMSRFLEHMPIDFLWTNRKEKCDYIDQAKNPNMTINKFHRAPFTSKEGLCAQLKDFHWFYEEGMAEMYFPRCFNVWSLEELADFVENFKLTACIAVMRLIVDRHRRGGVDAIFSQIGTVPYTTIDFAYKRCGEYIDSCQHKDIDGDDVTKVWEHEWDAFLHHHNQLASEDAKILVESRPPENTVKMLLLQLEQLQSYWPQYTLDGYQNMWIVKPANKCRGRGIQLMDNLKKILMLVNPSIGSKSRYVVQKYIERPLTIHRTKFDIRQWFLITNVQPLVVWMYKESYLRFSSQQYSLSNHHESVHLTNHAVQKKYTNGKRDKRLPNENMWDCYSFQAYLRQIGKHDMWLERIYPGMKKAIVGTMLSSQENMDRRPNTFELFGADFMVCEDFYPWLIEINSSPDLSATTSVTARMCPQCLEDVIKVVVDRRQDPKADLGNFELIYRQNVPPTPAYMGLNLFVKGKQIATKSNHHHHHHHHHSAYRERPPASGHIYRQRATLIPAISNVHKAMPTFNATDYIEKYIAETTNSSRSSLSGINPNLSLQHSPLHLVASMRQKATAPAPPCPNLLKTPHIQIGIRRRSYTNLSKATAKPVKDAPVMPAAKRHRSCGPTLNTVSPANDNDKNFKFIIKKCTIKPDHSSNATTTTEIEMSQPTPTIKSKSEDNIIQLLRNTTVNAQQLQKRQALVTQPQPQRQQSRSQSNLTDKSPLHQKWKSTRCQSLKAPALTKANGLSNEAAASKRDIRRENSTLSLRTVGRGLTTWRAHRRNTFRIVATTTTATDTTVSTLKTPIAVKSTTTNNTEMKRLRACSDPQLVALPTRPLQT